MKTLLRLLFVCGAFALAVPARGADVTALVGQLKSPDSDVRRLAAKSLAEMGTEAKAAAPALIVALKSDKDLFVRRFAAQALGEVGADPKAAVPALRGALREDRKELVEAAILALGKLGPTAVPPLVEALKGGAASPGKNSPKKGPAPTDHTAFLRAKAAEALGQIGEDAKPAVPALVAALKDAGVRTEAATALGNIGPAAKEAVTPLQDAAADKANRRDKAFRQAALDAVKKIQGKN